MKQLDLSFFLQVQERWILGVLRFDFLFFLPGFDLLLLLLLFIFVFLFWSRKQPPVDPPRWR